MAYTKNTNFTAKDALASGDPNKVVKGSEIDAEFDEIESEDALNCKLAGTQTLTGDKTLSGTTVISGTTTLSGDTTLSGSDTHTGVKDFTGATLAGASPLVLEGATADDFETTIAVTDPTADRTLTLPDKTGTIATTDDVTQVTLATAQATTSGTAIDFTSIPSGTKFIRVMFAGVSTDGTEELLIQIGDAGGVETSGYTSTAETGTSRTNSTAGFIVTASGAGGDVTSGHITLSLENSSAFTWTASGTLRSNSTNVPTSGGSKSLSAELTQIRITTTGTPDDFDAGEVNIQYGQ